MVTVGNQLLNPEIGYQRIDSSNSKILYTGAWVKNTDSSYYGGTSYSTTESNANCKVRFYGSKIRLISYIDLSLGNNHIFKIDGQIYNFNQIPSSGVNPPSGTGNQCIVFEQTSLTLDIHNIEIIKGIGTLQIDAFDIDDTGYLITQVGQVYNTPDSGYIRYDQNNSKIIYSNGTWTINNITTSAYGGSHASSNTLGATITFKFYGTKIRLLSNNAGDRSNNIKIYIDGILDNSISEYNSNTIYQILVYEKLNLNEGIHEVKIINNTTNYIILDAIDIDNTGYLITQVGQQLLTPDIGWKRIDDSDNRILYTGTKLTATGSYNNGTITYFQNNNCKIQFKFYGTKLRIIDTVYSDRSNNIQIKIDGNIYNYSDYSSSLINQVLVFEKNSLPLKVHYVEITNNINNSFGLDAIDIDSDGIFYGYKDIINKFLLLDSVNKYYVSTTNELTIINNSQLVSDDFYKNMEDLSRINNSIINNLNNDKYRIALYRLK